MTLLLASTAIAAAEPAEPHAPPQDDAAAPSPSFVMLDRQSAASDAGIDISYIRLPNSLFHAVFMEAHARYVDRRVGIGGYARVPFGRGWGNCNECASASAVGDLELGALYARSVAAGWAIVAHAGIALPTLPASKEFALADAVAARIEDIALAIPGGTTLRLGVSQLFRSGHLVAQLDVGLDVNVSNRLVLPDSSRDENIAPIVHLGGGIGMDYRFFNIGTEIVASDFNSADYMMNAALAVRLHLQRFQPYAAIVVPVTNGNFDFAITGGLDMSLP